MLAKVGDYAQEFITEVKRDIITLGVKEFTPDVSKVLLLFAKR